VSITISQSVPSWLGMVNAIGSAPALKSRRNFLFSHPVAREVRLGDRRPVEE